MHVLKIAKRRYAEADFPAGGTFVVKRVEGQRGMLQCLPSGKKHHRRTFQTWAVLSLFKSHSALMPTKHDFI